MTTDGNSPPEPLSFAAFQALLADILHMDAERLRPEAYFITDLGVDSLRMVEVLLRLEKMGVEVSPQAAWEIQTVEDAYGYYCRQVDKEIRR
jgi:acyl carrier protein